MLQPSDMQNIANLIDSNRSSFSVQEMGGHNDVDISHLDYNYIRECNDKREILTLLNYLISGKEGSYPDLELFMRSRLAAIDPTNHPMPLTPREIYEAKESVSKELEEWAKSTNSNLKNLPTLKTVESPTKMFDQLRLESNRIKATDYRSWDKFNVDQESEKVDKMESLNPAEKTKIFGRKHINQSSLDSLSNSQKQYFAEKEKIKGNDCVRALEYQEALDYYNSSLELFPTFACYNNRALVKFKLGRYSDSIEDCNNSLDLEKNFKAYLRRSHAYYSLGNYQAAIMDVDCALGLDGDSKEAISHREKVQQKWAAINESQSKSNGSKMKIVEIVDEEKVEIEHNRIADKAFASFRNSHESGIIEIDDDYDNTKEVLEKSVIVDCDDDSSDEENCR